MAFWEVDQHLEKYTKLQKTRAIIGSMMVHFCVGTFFVFGNINTYIAAKLHHFHGDISSQTTLIVQPVWLLFQTFVTIAGLFLAEKFGFKIVTVVALFGFALVNVASAYVENFYLFVLAYGVGSGLTMGLCYLLSMYIAWTYFPNHKSFVTGMCLLATGLSPSVLSPLTSYLCNPDNIEDVHDQRVWGNVKRMFLWLAALYSVIDLLIIVVLPSPMTSKRLRQHTEEPSEGKIWFKLEPFKSPLKKKFSLLRSINQHSTGSELQRLGITNKSVVALEKEIMVNNMRNVITSESLLLFENIPSKYLENLQMLTEEEQERTTLIQQDLALRSPVVMRKRMNKTVADEKDFKKLQMTLLRAEKDDAKIGDYMQNEQLIAIVSENLDRLKEKDIERIAREVILAQCPSMKVGLKHPTFWILIIMAFCSTTFNYFMNAAWKTLAESRLDMKDSELSLMLTVAGIFEAISGLISGLLMLKFPFKCIYIYQLCLQILATGSIYFLAKDYLSVTIYVSLSMYFLGSDKTIYPTITQKIFGPVAGPRLYPLMYVFFAISSFYQFLIYKFVTVSFGVLFSMFCGLSIVALICTIFVNIKPDWSKYHKEGTRYRSKKSTIEMQHDDQEKEAQVKKET